MALGDTSGDQIVPVSSLGTRYIVPRGHLYRAQTKERFYLVATTSDTIKVKVYYDANDASKYTMISLYPAGDADRYTFPQDAGGNYLADAMGRFRGGGL
jgi:hypothetical protein